MRGNTRNINLKLFVFLQHNQFFACILFTFPRLVQGWTQLRICAEKDRVKVFHKLCTTSFVLFSLSQTSCTITYLAGLFPWSYRRDGIGGVRALHSASYELDLGSRKRVADGTISCSTCLGVHQHKTLFRWFEIWFWFAAGLRAFRRTVQK